MSDLLSSAFDNIRAVMPRLIVPCPRAVPMGDTSPSWRHGCFSSAVVIIFLEGF